MVHHRSVQQKHTLIYRQLCKLMIQTWEAAPLHLFQCVSYLMIRNKMSFFSKVTIFHTKYIEPQCFTFMYCGCWKQFFFLKGDLSGFPSVLSRSYVNYQPNRWRKGSKRIWRFGNSVGSKMTQSDDERRYAPWYIITRQLINSFMLSNIGQKYITLYKIRQYW